MKSKYETHVLPRFTEIEDWLRNGALEKEVIQKLGIGESAFYDYKRKYSEFAELLTRTEDVVDAEVEAALYKSAIEGNTTAQVFWLKNRRYRKWREHPEIREENGQAALMQICNAISGAIGNDDTD